MLKGSHLLFSVCEEEYSTGRDDLSVDTKLGELSGKIIHSQIHTNYIQYYRALDMFVYYLLVHKKFCITSMVVYLT